MQHINESLSLNGKIAFNEDKVSFKTNTLVAVLQHLAFQYNDRYLGSIKTVKWPGKALKSFAVDNISRNGTPYIFDTNIDKETVDIKLSAENRILKMSFLHEENEKVMAHTTRAFVNFFVFLQNGTWYLAPEYLNKELSDDFDELDTLLYTNIDLPTTKLPKIISPIDSINNAKSLLNSFAKENNLQQFVVSTFTPNMDAQIMSKMSVSKYSSFMPDLSEFGNTRLTVQLTKDNEVAYLLNSDEQYIILYSLDIKKWMLIDDELFVNAITSSMSNVFIDSIKNSNKAAELNKNLKSKDIYESIARMRAILLLNVVAKEFTQAGYFYVQNKSFHINTTQYQKFSINADNFLQRIYNAEKDLVLYKDTIVGFVTNMDTGLTAIFYPSKPDLVYLTTFNVIPELVREFNSGSGLDTVVSISDIYFKDSDKKKK
jgi:hypothetical protein